MDRKRLKEEAEKFFHASSFTEEMLVHILINDFETLERVVDGEELQFRTDVFWEDKAEGIAHVMVSVDDGRLSTVYAPPAYGEPYTLSPASMAEIARREAAGESRRGWSISFGCGRAK